MAELALLFEYARIHRGKRAGVAQNGRQKKKPAPGRDWLRERSRIEGKVDASQICRLALVGVEHPDLVGDLLVAAGPAVLHGRQVRGQQAFQQPADALPAVADRALSGAENLGDAGVRMAPGGQADDPFVGLEGVPGAGQVALGEAGSLARLVEHAFQDLVGEPVEAQRLLVDAGAGHQPFVGHGAIVVVGCVQGERIARVAAADLPQEIVADGVARADEAKGRVPAVAELPPVGHTGDLDQVFHVLGSDLAAVQAQPAAGAIGRHAAPGQPFGLDRQGVGAHLGLLSSVM